MGETYFKCEKCGKEHVMDLGDPEVFDWDKYEGYNTVTLSYKCKKCDTNTWLLFDLQWDNGTGQLKGWSIKRSVHISDQRKISVKSVQTKPSKSKSKGVDTPDKHVAHDPNFFKNAKRESMSMNERISSLNNNDELSEERLLSAIWLAFVKLKLHAKDRAELMNMIENMLEDINTQTKNDKE